MQRSSAAGGPFRRALPWSLATLATLPGIGAARDGQDAGARGARPLVRLGETVSGTLRPEEAPDLGRGPSRRFQFAPEATGPVTLSLESLEFDAYLRLEAEDGSRLAEDENSGVETNARLAFEAKAGTSYALVVAAAAGERGGDFTLAAGAGAPAFLEGAALADAQIAYRAAAAERALARGSPRAAASHRLAEAERRNRRGQFREARAALESALGLYRDAKDRGGEARATGNLGHVLLSLGEVALARRHFEAQLRIAEETGDRSEEASAQGGLGSVAQTVGDIALARGHLERQVVLLHELGDRSAEATELGNLGSFFLNLGEYGRAKEICARHLSLARELKSRGEEMRALGSLGLALWGLGENAASRENQEESLRLARILGDRAAEARAEGSLGHLHFGSGEYGKARERYERWLEISRELARPAGEMKALANLGNLAWRTGDHAVARERFERALALARDLGDRGSEAAILGNLGNLHVSLADPARAAAYYEEQLRRVRDLGNAGGELTTLANLGNLALSLGDDARAAGWLELALALARRLGDRIREAAILGDLSLLLARRGDSASALQSLEAFLEDAREGGHRAAEAAGGSLLARLLSLLGRQGEAREAYGASLAAFRELGDRSGEAAASEGLASVAASLGDHAEARRRAEAARDLRAEVGDEEGLLSPLLAIARASIALADLRSAAETLARADAILERPSLRRLELVEATGWRSRFAAWGRIAQDVATLRLEAASDPGAKSRAIEEGFGWAGRWKGRALLEGIVEHRGGGRSRKATELRRERRDLLVQRGGCLEQVAGAIRRGAPPEEIEGLRERGQALLEKAEALATQLRDVSARDAALDSPGSADPERIREALGRRTALLEYAEGESRLQVYVLTDRILERLDLGDREEIARDVEAYVRILSTPGSLGSRGEIAEGGRSLFEVLLAGPLRAAGGTVDRLVVVPTTPLSGLPFEALVIGAKEEGRAEGFAGLEFVIDRYEVAYGLSSPVLTELASLGPPRQVGRFLVLADPLYAGEGRRGPPDAGDARSDASGAGKGEGAGGLAWPRIGKTREEARSVAESQLDRDEASAAEAMRRLGDPRRRSGSASTGVFDLHWGAEASPRRLAGNLRNYSVLHLAAHGYAGREFPRRTGLVLSGENGNDAYFTVSDVLDLDLDANLVVLSGCETARGELREGEGVESMARAFLYAGARAVAATLWQVEDTAAAETMRAFYEGWLGPRNRPPAQALREAKLAVRLAPKSRGVAGVLSPVDSGHPFFWAPFTYVGLPR